MMITFPGARQFLKFIGKVQQKAGETEKKTNAGQSFLTEYTYKSMCVPAYTVLVHVFSVVSSRTFLFTFSFFLTECVKVCQHRVEDSRRRMQRENKGSRGVARVTAADGWGRFFWRGPLHSGVLQQVMHTELSLLVQNCW